jgi:hypothetical protein
MEKLAQQKLDFTSIETKTLTMTAKSSNAIKGNFYCEKGRDARHKTESFFGRVF